MFRRLLIATLIGILAALAVAAFRHAMQLLEWIFLSNDTGSLVNAAEGLSPWRRLITPALGGLAAGLLLWGWQKMNQQRPHAPTDYMEALQTDGQFDVGASLVKSLASLLVVVSGSAIGREGAMILLAALAASSFARRFTPREEWKLWIASGAAAGMAGAYHAGGFIVLALALMKGDLRAETQQRVIACMFGLWVLMGIGFIASMLHLGSPMRAFNSLNRVGASALSNEIASGSVFFAVGGIGWLLAVLKKLPPALRTLWLIITMVLGVVFVWMMVRVYNSIDTVPTWYSVWTPLGFFLTLFMGGPLLGYLLLRIAGVNGWAMRLLPAVSVLALVVIAIMVAMQGAELATIHSSIQQASALVPDYGSLMAWRMVLLAAALCCWIVPQLKGYQPAVPLLSVAFILMLAGELIGRGVFYGLHMTVGMAVAS